jgi:hypothetical protein
MRYQGGSVFDVREDRKSRGGCVRSDGSGEVMEFRSGQ